MGGDSVDGGDVRLGVAARIHGLESAKNLNGMLCQVVRPVVDGRCVVATMNGEVSIRPEKLVFGRLSLPATMQYLLALACALTMLLLCLVAMPAGAASTVAAPLVPLLAMGWLLGTLASCYWIHWPLRDRATLVPAISEMGVVPPASGLYRLGFTVVGILLACTVWLYDELLMRHLVSSSEEDSTMASSARRSVLFGYVSAAGVVLQGLFTLELRLNARSILHFAGALLYMIGTMQHANLSNELLGQRPDASATNRAAPAWQRAPATQGAAALRRMTTDYGPLAMMTLPLGVQVLRRAAPSAGGMSPEGSGMQTVMGLMQWALAGGRSAKQWRVLNFAVFFCSYSCDIWAAGRYYAAW